MSIQLRTEDKSIYVFNGSAQLYLMIQQWITSKISLSKSNARLNGDFIVELTHMLNANTVGIGARYFFINMHMSEWTVDQLQSIVEFLTPFTNKKIMNSSNAKTQKMYLNFKTYMGIDGSKVTAKTEAWVKKHKVPWYCQLNICCMVDKMKMCIEQNKKVLLIR